MRKRIGAILLTLALIGGVFLAGCGGSKQAKPEDKGQPQGQAQQNTGAAAKKLKVALVLPGPINDNGWNSVAYEGLKKAQAELGIEGAYRENVTQSDMEEAFRAYANQGYDVIIGHGFQFNDVAKKVGKDFPKVKFIVTSSNIAQGPNVASLEVSNKEAGFIGGILAGLLTKSNKVAFIGGVNMPPITDAEAGFKAGAKMVNPKVEALGTLIGSWDDVAKAKETALAFIQQGADVVLGDANQAGLGVIEAAKSKNVYAVGFAGDQSNVAPDNVPASSKYDYSVAIKYIVKEILDGKFEARGYVVATKEGATGIIWNEKLKSKLNPEAVQKAEQVQKDLIEKKIDVNKL
ncbi:ABC transporter substrate-binding protein PnrA-like protein [Neomoorella glycerini]|uniref:ABC transporter substrate-binding protein PnrA-like protein n=1 Tax=Neomoorella glycerini TaxID=55779 RepID=A0A6I5ZMT8_9FIRM|nr:BMP family protein [Moorella glycerini]QGP91214.1 ABC transporter substrate-binding protein PnrA-like protein [Moorella glycerini]